MIHDIIENMYVEQRYTSQILPVRSLVDKGISMDCRKAEYKRERKLLKK